MYPRALPAPLSLPAADLADPALRRRIRVVSLIAAIVLMSVADLHMTLTFLQGVGMSEGNPIARWIISHDSVPLLVVFKLGLLGSGCVIFYLARRTRAAEMGCWICFIVLLWLCLRWMDYSHEMSTLNAGCHVLSLDSETWVRLSP